MMCLLTQATMPRIPFLFVSSNNAVSLTSVLPSLVATLQLTLLLGTTPAYKGLTSFGDFLEKKFIFTIQGTHII
jgi:hypothetical protein